ncbi:MAG: nucleotide exchange factor GrpE [Verrucomicrobia bacterium]|nr:MAG: nucleotide exchange factor GrpE [Verrucomicrobiota bacterium]
MANRSRTFDPGRRNRPRNCRRHHCRSAGVQRVSPESHIYALYQAAVRSGQSNLVEQLGLFQDSCRDVARRVGLVPFTAIPGESYDSKLHQLADSGAVPAAEARVAETVANGYSFQGQLVRPALVTLQPGESPEPSAPDAFAAGDENRTQSSTAEENSSPNQPGTETEGEVSATPPEEAAETPTGNAESAQEFAHQESPDSDEEQFRS